MNLGELLLKLGVEVDQEKVDSFLQAVTLIEDSNAEAVLDGVSDAMANASAEADATAESLKQVAVEAQKAGDKAEKAAERSGNSFLSARRKVVMFKGALTFIAGAASFVSVGIVRNVSAVLEKIDELAASKNQLFQISKQEVAQAKEFQKGVERSSQLMDSLKARVALGLLPTIMKLISAFNDLLVNNKELISEGLIQVLKVILNIARVVVHFIGAIDNVVKSTIGWRAALLLLALAFGIVKRAMLLAFVTNPIGWVILAIIAVIAILDDLFVYLRGGESQFAAFWGPAVKWAKKVWQWFSDTMAAIVKMFEDAAETFNSWMDSLSEIFSKVVEIITTPFRTAFGIVTALFDATIGRIAKGIQAVGRFLGFGGSGESGQDGTSGAASASAASAGAQSNNATTINNKGGDVKADITVVSSDPNRAGEKVKDSMSQPLARANQNMQGARAA